MLYEGSLISLSYAISLHTVQLQRCSCIQLLEWSKNQWHLAEDTDSVISSLLHEE